MAEKVTLIMVMNVDLQCCCCCKKVKKILCKFPQIRDQVYDEKANTVTITVICCNPEKIRDELCRKGNKIIKTIKIKESSMPQEKQSTPPPEKGRRKSEQPALTPPENCGLTPCYFGFRVAAPPGNDVYGYHKGSCHVTRCDYYISEENSESCSIM